MSSLEYSAGALSALSLFHRKKHVIYVEGVEDVRFWEILLKQLGLTDFLVKPAGGVGEIKKYTEDILVNDAKIVVARDRDFDDFERTVHKNPRIIYTYGHSIENTLLSKKILNQITMNYLMTSRLSFEQEIVQWYDKTVNDTKQLLALEIANALYKKRISVMGKSCVRFLPNNKAHYLCPTKVQETLTNLKHRFLEKEIIDAHSILAKIKKHIIWHIRGHFLTGIALNFIKHIVKREKGSTFTLEHDSFYVMLISTLNVDLLETADRRHLKKQVETLLLAA